MSAMHCYIFWSKNAGNVQYRKTQNVRSRLITFRGPFFIIVFIFFFLGGGGGRTLILSVTIFGNKFILDTNTKGKTAQIALRAIAFPTRRSSGKTE